MQNDDHLFIPYSGSALLETPLLNKGSAFNEQERNMFNLTGLLPPRYESIEDQADRAYKQFNAFSDPLNKHIFLRAIQDNNETLFYRLITDHIEEVMPIIYTPTVGDACEQFSDIYRSSRGLFISYEQRYDLDTILRNATKRNVKVIVVTDGERILGLGDQGIGGMGIPIGKLSLYTACGGISPAYTLPVMLDVGTNNEKLLDDPFYMGQKHKRIDKAQYDEFLDLFIKAAKKRWPNVMIQFEDFAQKNATSLLNRFQDEICCFNDDIQGTAAVTLATIIAACQSQNKQLSKMKIVFVGAGSAGCGIAEMLIKQMCAEGLSDEKARQQIFMVDRFGLITSETPDLLDFQKALVKEASSLQEWKYKETYPSLIEVIEYVNADVLIGVSGQAGLFTQNVVQTMKKHCENPIIFPLSNPIKHIEAHPRDVIKWTDGNCTIATGSPFDPIEFNGKTITIPQCNNSYIFPGIGLGVIACKAIKISDEMLMAAANTLANESPKKLDQNNSLLPCLTEISELSKKIAFAVAKTAIKQGFAFALDDDGIKARIEANFWQPEYRKYKRVSI